MAQRWLLKTEPESYSYADLEREGKAVWDGVSNNAALKNLRSMAKGDEVIIYHTGDEKSLVGLAQVTASAYPDPKKDDPKLVVVDLKPKRKLPRAVTLAEVKANPKLKDFDLVRLPRLSVMPVSEEQWKLLADMAGVK
ncbi:MAG TPA: EVE domain-containing protein [Blastocatellia bacterium]|nr:EVE domain-containing protein [Blastocatellia bacterium]